MLKFEKIHKVYDVRITDETAQVVYDRIGLKWFFTYLLPSGWCGSNYQVDRYKATLLDEIVRLNNALEDKSKGIE